jgi:hypothetical protein
MVSEMSPTGQQAHYAFAFSRCIGSSADSQEVINVPAEAKVLLMEARKFSLTFRCTMKGKWHVYIASEVPRFFKNYANI